jgi:hypothetical protein
MDTTKRLTTIEYTDQVDDLDVFCQKCGELGYKNNDSVKAMKLDWCRRIGGQYFLTYDNKEIIAVSGCHPLPEVGATTWRLLFRGANLKNNIFGVMSKSHMTSTGFFYHMLPQVAWAQEHGGDQFVITTNWVNPEIKSMEKSHRTFKLLERQGLVSCLVEKMELFNTIQTVWQLNLSKYSQLRQEFIERNVDIK